MQPTIKINEGCAEILVPENKRTTSKIPFFNPVMKLNRDFTIAIAKTFKVKKFLDGLSACGALSIRMKKEIPEIEVNANELRDETMKFLQKNKENNDVDITIHNKDLNLLLNGDKNFDFIDIDPFGSPVNFLSNVLLNARHNAIIGITATDLGTLCGTYPDACLRRYFAFSSRTDFDKEFGLRNLIGYTAREAAKFEAGIEILFSYYFMHYFKVYFRVKRLRSFADKTLKNLNFLLYCDKCMSRKYVGFDEMRNDGFCECRNKFKILGPLWSDKFTDESVCDLLVKEVHEKTEQKILDLVKNEQNIMLPYYDLHKFCKINRMPIKGMENIMKAVKGIEGRNLGLNLRATRTHFEGTGLRFNGSVKELLEILK